MNISMTIGMLGGIGLFLYGMAFMASSLEKAAGNKMRRIIEMFTKNKLFGVGVGAAVTMIIQSSSATTVMVVGFVNAGIMTLVQATGVIMGANIGTTITAQLIAFDLDKVAPLITGVSVIAWLIVSNKNAKNILEVFIGFGILFIGMGMMKDALSGLNQNQDFVGLLLSLDGKSTLSFMGLIGIGLVVTGIIQSSSTVTGIMIAMATQGLLTIDMAMPLILGTNIGTCVTALLSSIGANRNAKRAAVIHLLFNITGVILFTVLLNKVVMYFVLQVSGGDIAREIANIHTIFNVSVTLLILPFSNFLVKAAQKIIPLKKSEESQFEVCLDERMLETPGIAIAQVYNEMFAMSELVRKNYLESFNCLLNYNYNLIEEIKQNETVINYKQREIKEYLEKLAQTDVSASQHREINMMHSMTNDIERVGDHAENIAELAEYKNTNKITFSEAAIGELQQLHDKVYTSCIEMIEALKRYDLDLAKQLIKREEEINELEKVYREGHMQRLNEGACSTSSGVIFLDVISNMERVSDRIKKVGYIILDSSKTKEKQN